MISINRNKVNKAHCLAIIKLNERLIAHTHYIIELGTRRPELGMVLADQLAFIARLEKGIQRELNEISQAERGEREFI